ncbi:MAG: phage tail protein [Thermoanaerobaculia bacterium]
MDVNGTRFHLFLGREDWSRCTAGSGKRLADVFLASDTVGDAELSWDGFRHEMTLGRRAFHFTPSAGNRPADPSGRRGAAADVHGNVYWIDPSGTEILVHSAGSRVTSHFWGSLDGVCPRERGLFAPVEETLQALPIRLSGLTITTQHLLVVGTTDPAGLLAFDLQIGGEPRQILWPVPFAPIDLAAAPDGGVWVLDGNARVWRLDRTLGVIPLGGPAPGETPRIFQPVGGGAPKPCLPSSTIDVAMAAPIPAAAPVAIEALPDDSVLILVSPAGERFSRILRLKGSSLAGEVSTEVAASLVEESKRESFRLLGHDFAVLERRGAAAGDGALILFVVASEGDQAFAFRIEIHENAIQFHALSEFFPMRHYGARALIGGGDQPLYDSQDRWVPLVAQPRYRYATSATVQSRPLDGKEPDCVWHRLLLDACIPAETDVIVWSRADNDPELLQFASWQREPSLLCRPAGSELPWVKEGAGLSTWELLFQRAKGRWIELKLELRGTGRSSPRIRALRAWYPRFSYLDEYLPALYRENDESAAFLDRFLANLEGFFTNIEDRVAAAQCLLDARCAPAETLEWLAGWFGVALDPAWDEAKRRLFLRHASHFFKWRGTAPGLMMVLRLAFDDCADESAFELVSSRPLGARIVERFRSRNLPAVIFGDTSEVGAGLPLRPQRPQWVPGLGAADLHDRWAKKLARPGALYPLTRPDRAGEADAHALWPSFSRETLGFVPRSVSGDLELWRELLRRRYTTAAEAARAWSRSWTSWSHIMLPAELPTSIDALRDWVQFEGLVLPARDAAHRFTVFLPQGTLAMQDREKRLDLARRVIALEKPAHTSFEVKFFWAFLRVGEARLGEETVVDLGSRSPELLAPFVLNRDPLGSGRLAAEGRSALDPAPGCPSCTRGGTE